MIKFIKKGWRILLQIAWTMLAALLLLELIYRQYWFDFYKPELEGLNPVSLTQTADSTLLIFGDSFSAHPLGYIAQWMR